MPVEGAQAKLGKVHRRLRGYRCYIDIVGSLYIYIEDIWVEKEKLNKHLHGIHDIRSIPRIGSRIVTAPEDMSSDSIRT